MNSDYQKFNQGSNPTLTARLCDEDGKLLAREDVFSITLTVRSISTGWIPKGFNAKTVPVESTVFGTLQTDKIWRLDSIGYNWRYTLPGTVSEPALPWKGEYRIDVVFVRKNAVPFVLQFQCEVI